MLLMTKKVGCILFSKVAYNALYKVRFNALYTLLALVRIIKLKTK